jgi:hypothetical protein
MRLKAILAGSAIVLASLGLAGCVEPYAGAGYYYGTYRYDPYYDPYYSPRPVVVGEVYSYRVRNVHRRPHWDRPRHERHHAEPPRRDGRDRHWRRDR